MYNEPKYYQHYEVHMKNGEKIDVYEDYSIPVMEGIIGEFKRGKKKFLDVSDLLCGFVIPYAEVSFIAILEVKKGRNTPHAIVDSHILAVIYVAFYNFHLTGIKLFYFVNSRRKHAARTAPLRPEIYEYNLVVPDDI